VPDEQRDLAPGLLAAERSVPEVPADLGLGHHRGIRIEVCLGERAEAQAVGVEDGHGSILPTRRTVLPIICRRGCRG
jgi:hypothetical protein